MQREKTQQLRDLADRAREFQEEAKTLRRQGSSYQETLIGVEEDIKKLESSSGRQETKLQQKSRDTYQAWQWIQKNQDQFQQQVFGPPMVECSLKDPKYADAVESLFQNNDFLFLTVQNQNDFGTLQRVLFGEMKLHDISLRVCSTKLDGFRAPLSQEQMRELGFESFAIDLLTGPEPLLAILCSEKRFHQTPIGFREISDDQHRRIEQSGLTSWVTGQHSYLVTRRREYGDAGVSQRVRNIRKATVWTDQPVDLGRKQLLSRRKAEVQSDIEDIRKRLSELESVHKDMQSQANQIKDDRTMLEREKDKRQKAMVEHKALPTKLGQYSTFMLPGSTNLDVAEMEQKLNTVNEAFQNCRDRVHAIIDERNEVLFKKAELAIRHAQKVSKLRELHVGLLEAEILQIEAKSDFETLKSRTQEMNDMLEAKKKEEKEALEAQLEAANKAKSLVDAVKKLADEGKENPRFNEFIQTINRDISSQQLEANIESEKAQLELTHETDGSIIKEFEKRQKQIDETRRNLERRESNLNEIKAAIDEIRGKWEPELDALVNKISEAFSDSFARIGCAGQVSIHKASSKEDGEELGMDINDNSEQGNGLDFGNWAIHIYVKFRESEPLSLLDSHRQSGGERAVSTIFYLMALQTLSRAPFRVVDEINQGMDPRNERMVHGRMVDIACDNDGEGNGSQYFLITPKLLSGLKYKRGMKILCIVSGEQMPSAEEQESDSPGSIGKVDFREWIKRAQRIGLNSDEKRIDSGLGIGRRRRSSNSLDESSQPSQLTQVGA